eukprot:768096-Hanusia_phi.AAC.3
MEDSVREWIVKNLALFLDEETRPQLEFSHLYTLQQYKSTTDPRLWRELRKEARRTIRWCSCRGPVGQLLIGKPVSVGGAAALEAHCKELLTRRQGQGSENFQGIVECRADEVRGPWRPVAFSCPATACYPAVQVEEREEEQKVQQLSG